MKRWIIKISYVLAGMFLMGGCVHWGLEPAHTQVSVLVTPKEVTQLTPRDSGTLAKTTSEPSLQAVQERKEIKIEKSTNPINPNASQETKDLLNYLYSVSGIQTLTGIHNFLEAPDLWTDQVKKDYGDYPAIAGFEMGAIIGQNETTLASQRQKVINSAINHHNRGGIVFMSWHQNYPFTGNLWSSVNRPTTDAEFDRICTPGTAEYDWMIAEMDKVAVYLKQLRDANIPVIFRPYHEMNGGWFWWGKKKNYHRLWDIMYDRFTNANGLDNLLWVWNANATKDLAHEDPYSKYFVGVDKVDILSADLYMNVTRGGTEPFLQSYHDDLVAISGGKPIAIAEIGHLPPVSYFNGTKWAWFMTWGNYYKEPITLSGESKIQNTQADRDGLYKSSVNRTLNLSEVNIPTTIPDTQKPTVPTYLETLLKTTNSIQLIWGESWDAVGVTAYEIYNGDSLVGTSTTSNFYVTGLNADTTYSFKVRAKDDAGNLSPFSTTHTVTTDAVNTNFIFKLLHFLFS